MRHVCMSYHFRDRSRCKKIRIASDEGSCDEDEDYAPSCTSNNSDDVQSSVGDESSDSAENDADDAESDADEEVESDLDMDETNAAKN